MVVVGACRFADPPGQASYSPILNPKLVVWVTDRACAVMARAGEAIVA